MEINKNITLYIILGIAIIAVLVMTFFPNMIYVFKDSGGSDRDICAPPSGKTLGEWQEHMSHHPSMYKECLE